MRAWVIGLLFSLSLVALAKADDRLNGATRQPGISNGWIQVHLQGDAATRGYQHGYLLSAEIEDAKKAVELSVTHEVSHSWLELRVVAEKISWPRIPEEYRKELQGIAEGLKAKGSRIDAIDLVAM